MFHPTGGEIRTIIQVQVQKEAWRMSWVMDSSWPANESIYQIKAKPKCKFTDAQQALSATGGRGEDWGERGRGRGVSATHFIEWQLLLLHGQQNRLHGLFLVPLLSLYA